MIRSIGVMVILLAGALVTATSVAQGPAACSDGLDNDGDGLVDFPSDPGCVDGADDNEVDPPSTPQDVAAEPGPGMYVITLRWTPVLDAASYHVYDAGSDNLVRHVGADEDEDPWDGRFTVHLRDIETGGPKNDFVNLFGGPTLSYEVTAHAPDAGGESARSAEVSATVFLACTPFPGVCATVHPTERIGALQHKLPGGDPNAPTVALEFGMLRLEAGGEFSEQQVVVPRANGYPDPSALNELSDDPVAITYTPRSSDFPSLQLTTEEDENSTLVVASLWKGRLLVYFAEDRITDVPFVVVIPFSSGPCDPDEGPDALGFECHRTPSWGGLAALAVLAGIALVARNRRWRSR